MNYTLARDSRIGRRRMNQDRVGHWSTSESLLMVVADGLGGHPRGELAAEIALEHFRVAFAREATPRIGDPDFFLSRAIAGSHAAILETAAELGLRDTPRTVIAAGVVQEGYVHAAHVGDCRLYVLRRGAILQRTRDHTVVQHLIDAGRIREEAAGVHPERNRLLQCLGGFQPPRPDHAPFHRLEKNDVVLLCSDGFWGPLTQRHVASASLAPDLGRAVRELAELAETRAGPGCDNVSVVAMGWGEETALLDDSPRTIPQSDLPTAVQDFTATDPDFLRVSDEEIDRAVAEIKAALRKNSAR